MSSQLIKNARIQQLAAEAERQADEATNAFTDETGEWSRIWNDIYDQKFAELIIQECAKHIRDRAFQAGGACTTVGESSLWVAKDLLKQFGVEE